MTFDWLLVGGGIHGAALAFHLIHRRRVPPERVAILDPHPALLARWDRFTANTGMTHLRSPGVHHLNDDPFSLRTFALTQQGQPLADFIPIHQRPSLALFRAHSRQIIDRYGLQARLLRGIATGLQRRQSGWRVETSNGAMMASNVVLCIGAGDAPRWPDWASALREQVAINHIFEAGFALESLPDWSHLVVIGGGISAAQVAVTLAARAPATVTLMARHEARVAHFDSDPCWTTRQCLARFAATKDVQARRRMINDARQPGSMPPDVYAVLQSAIDDGTLRFVQDEVQAAAVDNDTSIQLRTTTASYTADRVLLATGFESRRPGGAWLDAAISEYDLPLAPDAYPLVDESLRWASGLFVTGPLAELEIGPASRNIIGARLAAARIGRCA